jgi:hypothetical protein
VSVSECVCACVCVCVCGDMFVCVCACHRVFTPPQVDFQRSNRTVYIGATYVGFIVRWGAALPVYSVLRGPVSVRR